MFRQLLGAAIAALALTAPGAGTALAQDKDKIVTERQDQMKQQGRDLVAVRNWFQGKGEQAAALAGVESAQKSVPKVLEWFPAGTAMDQVTVKSRAKAEIWTAKDKFAAADKTVVGQLGQLEAAVKSGDKAKTEALFTEIKFCEACHVDFRAPAQQ